MQRLIAPLAPRIRSAVLPRGRADLVTSCAPVSPISVPASAPTRSREEPNHRNHAVSNRRPHEHPDHRTREAINRRTREGGCPARFCPAPNSPRSNSSTERQAGARPDPVDRKRRTARGALARPHLRPARHRLHRRRRTAPHPVRAGEGTGVSRAHRGKVGPNAGDYKSHRRGRALGARLVRCYRGSAGMF